MASYHLAVGLGYVSASLKQAGHKVEVLNPNHSVEELSLLVEQAIKSSTPQVVAVGGMAFHLPEIRYVATLVRQLLPDTIIIVGGTLVSNQPELAMTAIPEANFGIVGEGEHTAVELLAALETEADPAKVSGLIFRAPETGALQRTSPRPIEQDLDALPWVDYDGLGLDVYAGLHRPGECAPALILNAETRVMPLLTSRGCPFPCTFCCHEAAGRRYRVRSLDDVFAEIAAAIARFQINALFIYDDLFCLKRERLLDFCRRVKPLNLRWECSLRVEQIETDVLRLMRDSGCCCISLGVESMSPAILDSMKKKTTREALERALAMIYDAEIGVWSNLIFGDPAETVATMRESLEWYCNNSRYNFRFANIGYHPGSRIYDKAVERGLIGDPIDYLMDWNCEINATSMSDQELHTMRQLADWALTAFGYAGRLVGLHQPDSQGLTAECLCPYCGATGRLHMQDARVFVTWAGINCPECNRAYRFPLCSRLASPPEVASRLDALRALELAGDDGLLHKLGRSLVPKRVAEMFWSSRSEKITAACRIILSLDPGCNEALQALVRLADAERQPRRAIALLQRAIQNDPYNPGLFEAMASRLVKLGEEAAAEKYRRKGEHLRAIGVEKTTYINLYSDSENHSMPLPASDQEILGALGSQLFY